MNAKDYILLMFMKAKQHHLIPSSCHEFEFTVGKTSNGDIICLGLEFWAGNKRFNEDDTPIKPTNVDIPPELQLTYNYYAACIIKEQYK